MKIPAIADNVKVDSILSIFQIFVLCKANLIFSHESLCIPYPKPYHGLSNGTPLNKSGSTLAGTGNHIILSNEIFNRFERHKKPEDQQEWSICEKLVLRQCRYQQKGSHFDVTA